jgi:RNA polymerase sigma-70 factor (ECF subfamily)
LSRSASVPELEAGDVVRAHAAFVYRVLLHLGVPEDRVEDASQEVFLVVLRQLPAFEGRSAATTWLYGICRNVAHSERRRRRRAPELPTDDLPETVVQAAQEGDLWARRAHARLIWALGELKEEQRTAFVLYEIEELTLEEIAAAEGAPLTTIHSRIKVARERLQALLRRSVLAPQRSGKEHAS